MNGKNWLGAAAAVAAGVALALNAGCTANDSSLGNRGTGGELVHLTASPSSVTQGQTTTLLWNHPEASSCTLSGTDPNGAPLTGFGGSVKAGGTATTPVLAQLTTSTNHYVFSLVCSDSTTGAAGTPETASVTVTPPTAGAPSITGQHADPNPVATGGTFQIIWTATPGSVCTVTGPGAPTGNVTSPVTVTASSTAGTYNYSITCTGADGQKTTVTVPVAVGNQVPLTVAPNQTQANGKGSGSSSTLLWSHPQATSCMLSGTVTPAGSTSPQPIPGSAFTNLPAGSTVNGNTITVPTGGTATTPVQTQIGTYTYTLACTDKTDPPATVTVGQQALPVATGNCDVPDINAGNATPLVDQQGVQAQPFTVSAPSSGLCIGCSVSGQGNLVDTDITNAATVNIPIGLLSLQAVNGVLNTTPILSALLGTGGLLGAITGPLQGAVLTPLGEALGGIQNINMRGNVDSTTRDSTTPIAYKAGQVVGFAVNPDQQLLAVGAVQFFSICPLAQDGSVISAACSENLAQPGGTTGGQADPVKLQLLNLTQGVAGTSAPNAFVSYVPPASQFGTNVDANGNPQFYGLQLAVAGLANVNNNTQVFYGCVANPAPAPAP
ncbi:MAG: hypothetical protein EPN72_10000 [Nevskiaceae bacterium]|nr:MAG: hypothetical protein EPN63_09340 [Nevskiaceae bacterium]TBR72757.1 MAG: hypothetical protein EPN72_10000 [Nevskiaceae bacterium]